jgi:hypothetical protein
MEDPSNDSILKTNAKFSRLMNKINDLFFVGFPGIIILLFLDFLGGIMQGRPVCD